MAKHTADVGRGSKPDKIIRDALLLELNRLDIVDGKKIKKVSRIVYKIVELAKDGKIDAIKEIFDRVEGKAVQGVTFDQPSGSFTIKWDNS